MTRDALQSDKYHLPSADLYGPLIQLIEKMDRLVDIFNSAGPQKDAPIIDSKEHRLLNELMGILGWFSDWRADLIQRGLDTEVAFFPRVVFDDPLWLQTKKAISWAPRPCAPPRHGRI